MLGIEIAREVIGPAVREQSGQERRVELRAEAARDEPSSLMPADTMVEVEQVAGDLAADDRQLGREFRLSSHARGSGCAQGIRPDGGDADRLDELDLVGRATVVNGNDRALGPSGHNTTVVRLDRV